MTSHSKLIITQVIKDNGYIKGMNLLFLFLLQKKLGLPREKVYSYNCKALDKVVKMIYSSNISTGLLFVEIYSILHYYQSSSRKMIFELNNKSKVIDLGGFIGDSAIFFAMQGAKVYSYEPQRLAYDLALRNIRLNSLSNKIKLFNKPVTQNEKLILIEDSSKISDSYSINNLIMGLPVRTVPLINILSKEKEWDILKIDIEGGEWDLIEYFIKKEHKLRKINGIIIELHGKNKILDKFIRLLKRRNYDTEIEYDEKDLGMLWAKKRNKNS